MNKQRIKAMYKACKRTHYKNLYRGDPVYHSPEFAVARRFKISCEEVRRIVHGKDASQEIN